MNNRVPIIFFPRCSLPRRHPDVILEWSDDNRRPLREVSESAAKGDNQDIKVIEYFRAQLELFSRMCFYRQYLGISKVKDLLPINVVLK